MDAEILKTNGVPRTGQRSCRRMRIDWPIAVWAREKPRALSRELARFGDKFRASGESGTRFGWPFFVLSPGIVQSGATSSSDNSDTEMWPLPRYADR